MAHLPYNDRTKIRKELGASANSNQNIFATKGSNFFTALSLILSCCRILECIGESAGEDGK